MKKIDLTNKQYGKLLVLCRYYDDTKRTKWTCQCICGNTCTRTSNALLNSKDSSCGCYRRSGKDHPLWKGYGDISAAWFENHVIRAAKGYYGARKLKEIDITPEYIWNLFLDQDKKCAYTRLPLAFPVKMTNKEQSLSTASLDRIDSDKGYVKGNVQWVHKKLNLMKNVLPHEEFVAMCSLVTTFNKITK